MIDRLAQIQDPPDTALVLLDDGTALNASGPTCVNSALASPPIRAKDGSVRYLRVTFSNIADKIAVRAVGLLGEPARLGHVKTGEPARTRHF